MKQMIILLIVALAATSALAAGRTTQEICTAASEDAWKIMDARQDGVPKALISGFNQDNKVAEYMIIRAYEQPMYSTEKERQRSIEEFADRMLAECYKAQQ